MDVSLFYRDLFEFTLSLDTMGLDNRFRDLVKLVDQKTLLAFGNEVPAFYLTYLDLGDPRYMVRKDHYVLGTEYYIADPVLDKFNLPILGVDRVEYSSTEKVDPFGMDEATYYNTILANRGSMTLEGVLFGSEYAYNRSIVDTALPYKRKQEYRGGKILYLENWGHDNIVEVKIKTRWPNVVSIPEEYREAFTSLAKLDMKIKLWNELKYIEDVVTPKGNLQLRVDWSSAEQEREEYLRTLKSKSMPDRCGASYFHIL